MKYLLVSSLILEASADTSDPPLDEINDIFLTKYSV